MKDQITVSREDLAAAARLAQAYGAVQAGGQLGPQIDLCHTAFGRGRVYAHAALRAQANPALLLSQPDLADVHIDGPLTNISIAYRNTMHIASMVFPRVPVKKESEKYFTFGRSPWIRDEAGKRGPDGNFPQGGYTNSNDNYSVDEWGFVCPVPDRVRRNADNPLNPDRNAVNFVSDKIDLKYEKRVASLAFTAANWTGSTTLVGTQQWSDYVNSTPITDMMTAQSAVLSNSGMMANTAAMGYEVYIKLAHHPDILDRIKYTGTSERPAMATPRMLAALFELDQLLVGRSLEDTSIEGGTASVSFVWGKKVWVGYVPAAPALETPAAGYVFTTGRVVDRYREEGPEADMVRGKEAFDEKVTAAGAGYLISAAVA